MPFYVKLNMLEVDQTLYLKTGKSSEGFLSVSSREDFSTRPCCYSGAHSPVLHFKHLITEAFAIRGNWAHDQAVTEQEQTTRFAARLQF